jgi:hypothetical protein
MVIESVARRLEDVGLVLRTAFLLLVVLPLAGCGANYVYLRADGQDLGSDPALYQQFEKDSGICLSEIDTISGLPAWGSGTNDVAGGGNAARECMREKGYLVVQADVAALKQQDLAAKAAEKAQRDAAAAAPPPAPPPPPVAPKQVAAKPKPKPKPNPKPNPQQAQSTAPPAPIWPTPTPPPASVDLFWPSRDSRSSSPTANPPIVPDSAAPAAATTSTGQR